MSINKIIGLCSCVLLMSACTGDKTREWFVTRNGNMPSNERISQISVGDSREKVRQVLGAPSTVVCFDKDTWIYMSSDVKRLAFFAPEEINRDVLTIRFGQDDLVKEITHLNKEDGQQVVINSDETEAVGEQVGFFRKYFGGVGQINPLGSRNSSGM